MLRNLMVYFPKEKELKPKNGRSGFIETEKLENHLMRLFYYLSRV